MHRHTVDALKSRLALVASVQRDGHWTTVPAATLVPGDLVKLSLGSVVAADVRLISGSTLLDQSMLTGESSRSKRDAGTEAYAGALVRRGEAVAVVTTTGSRTKFGRTAELVQEAKAESSEQKAILRVVRNLALFNGAATLVLAGVCDAPVASSARHRLARARRRFYPPFRSPCRRCSRWLRRWVHGLWLSRVSCRPGCRR